MNIEKMKKNLYRNVPDRTEIVFPTEVLLLEDPTFFQRRFAEFGRRISRKYNRNVSITIYRDEMSGPHEERFRLEANP